MGPKTTKTRGKRRAGKEETALGKFISEKEKNLQKEYATLTEHVKVYTERVDHFKEENDYLDKEAQQIRENNKAYLAYLVKRSLQCQNAIITLNDQNRSDLAVVLKHKAELTSQYSDKEKEVRAQLTEMETKYFLMTKEVDDLKPFKELQTDQSDRINELERELLAMKIHHSEQVHKIKSQFLQQKAEYEKESEQRVQALAKKAEKEAVRSLIQHTKQIKTENWRLRSELLTLLKRAQGLKAIVYQLREQKDQLLWELQYGEEIAHSRRWLLQKRASKWKDQVVPRTESSFPQITAVQQPMINSPAPPTRTQSAAEKGPET